MPITDARRISGTNLPAAQAISPEDVKPFGRYLLFRKLAEGGMAEIFLAKQLGEKGFERNVVIKRMLGHLGQQTDFVDMFLDEARIAARLAHPNIAQINDFGQMDGRYFICMEYLAGEDFSHVLRTASKGREYVPINVAVRVLIEAARGLHFAHEFTDDTGAPLNIVHRDISPSNIYVTYAGQVKVLDFGIAKAESRVTNTTAGVVKGKYMYMAPEQAKGLEDVDRRADVFSLGVSLYEALTNTRPFAKDNDLAILNAVLKGDYAPPRRLRPELPPELEAVVLKAMAADRAARYQSAHELAGDLERFLGASTSGSGGMQVAAYMKSLFGEERLAAKTTRIPSMTSIAAVAPVPNVEPVPGSGPQSRAELLAAETKAYGADEGRTGVVRTDPRKMGAVPKRFPVGKLLAGIGAAAVIAAGAFLLGGQWRTPVADPKVAEPVKPVEQPVVVTPEPVQKPQEVAAVTPTPTPTPVETPPPVEKEPKVAKVTTPRASTPLSGAEIARVVKAKQAVMLSCFQANRAELTVDQGVTQVQFTVLGSGAVTNVAVDGALAEANAGRCLKKQFQALKFRKHPDQEISLTLPFQWSVAR